MRGLGILIAALLFTFPAWAQALPEWKIDPAQSTLTFEATQMGAAFEGRFEMFSGDIVFSPDHPESSTARIFVDIASVKTGNAERDGYIGEPDWLDAGSFPQAVFKAAAFSHIEANRYVAKGALTLRGVTLPVDIPVTIDIGEDGIARAEGSFTVKRLEFGVGQGQWTDTTSVGDPVLVRFAVQANPVEPSSDSAAAK